MNREQLVWAVWPAFLAACALELLVFAFVDPGDLQWSGHPLALSRQGVYTVAFFLFWLITTGAGVLACVLRVPPADVDRCPYSPGERPDACLRR